MSDETPSPSATPPRPRSVVARALARHRVSTWLQVALPLVVIAAGCSISPHNRAAAVRLTIAVIAADLLVLLVLLGIDLFALASALRAARRRARGLGPVRRGVDFGLGDDVWLARVAAEQPYRAQDRLEPVAVGSPSLAATAICACLSKRVVLGTGAGLIAAMLAVPPLAPPYSYVEHERGTVRTAANTMRSATVLYRQDHPGTCPSVADLKAERFLDPGFFERDPWGNGWQIVCGDDEITATSWGPDRRQGTADDIVVPPPVDASVQP